MFVNSALTTFNPELRYQHGIESGRYHVHFQNRFGMSTELLKHPNNDSGLVTGMIIVLGPLDSFKLDVRGVAQTEG